jgi:hypothetical protein
VGGTPRFKKKSNKRAELICITPDSEDAHVSKTSSSQSQASEIRLCSLEELSDKGSMIMDRLVL